MIADLEREELASIDVELRPPFAYAAPARTEDDDWEDEEDEEEDLEEDEDWEEDEDDDSW